MRHRSCMRANTNDVPSEIKSELTVKVHKCTPMTEKFQLYIRMFFFLSSLVPAPALSLVHFLIVFTCPWFSSQFKHKEVTRDVCLVNILHLSSDVLHFLVSWVFHFYIMNCPCLMLDVDNESWICLGWNARWVSNTHLCYVASWNWRLPQMWKSENNHNYVKLHLFLFFNRHLLCRAFTIIDLLP